MRSAVDGQQVEHGDLVSLEVDLRQAWQGDRRESTQDRRIVASAPGHEWTLDDTTVARRVARAGKTRPVMTKAQIDEAVRFYGEGWTLHEVGRSVGVADQRIRRVLVGVPSRYDVTTR